MKTRILATAVCLFSILLDSCNDMTPVPRTQIHTSDLSADDFALLAGKVVSRTGLSGPYQLTEGTINEYTNQSGKPELVWLGGTEEEPSCAWVVFPDSTSMKLKWPTPNEEGFCSQVIECLAADIALGAGSPDKYRIPQMDGPTWRVVSVEWIEEDGDEVSTSFALDTGTDLTSLIASLNDSEELPEGWYWEILTSALALCVPHGTNIVKVVLEGGEEAVFNAVPTVEGTPSSELGGAVAINQIIVGNGAAVGSAHDTEAEIEAQFALMQNVTVRWTDAGGDERVSYKDPVNGWYHPVEKHINEGISVYSLSRSPGESINNYAEIDVSAHVGAGATHAYVEVTAVAQSPTSGTNRSDVYLFEEVVIPVAEKLRATTHSNTAIARETRDSIAGWVGLTAGKFYIWTDMAGATTGGSASCTVKLFGWKR